MKSLKAALISALAGQGIEIFLFFLGGVLLQKAEDPLKNLPFLTYLFIGLSAVFSGILSKLLHRDGGILTPLITGGILTAISLLLSLFTAQSGKTVGQSLLSAALTLLCPLLPAMFLKKSKASGKSSLRRARKRYRAG